ncbi:MAG: hypothetical protein JXA28_02485 [Bacteroidetes bacterium]|nr:hypothetical protein [Bacteroidota bacterium]
MRPSAAMPVLEGRHGRIRMTVLFPGHVFLMLVLLLPVMHFTTLQAQNSVVNTVHNLSVSGPGGITAQTETAVCVFCHTPHASTGSTPLWNRGQPLSTYQLYSSDYLQQLAVSYPAAAQPNPRSRMCLSCHDGTIAVGAVYNPASTGTPIPMSGAVTTMPSTSRANLGTDLRNDHPVGYPYSTASDPELLQRSWPWNTAVKLDPDASTGRIECHTCHNAHDDSYGYFLNMSNTGAALCQFCHQKTDWNTGAGVHKLSAQVLTPPGATSPTTLAEWSCRSCHVSHAAGSGPSLLRATEELTCLASNCHGSAAASTTVDIAGELTRSYRHPVSSASTVGYHINFKVEDAARLQTYRHAECQDCHAPHSAENGTHDGSTRDIAAVTGGSGVLKGVWGVEPAFGSLPTGMTDNDNVFSNVSSYTKKTPAEHEYQICLKCHSDYVTGTHRNIAEELDPRYPSYHGIMAAAGPGNSNPYCNTNTMNNPWGTSRIVWCSDCHGTDNTTNPSSGPHGSNQQYLLVATTVSSSSTGTPLCFVCHKESVYWSTSSTGSNFPRHPSNTSQHRQTKGCFGCHMYDYNSHASYNNGSYGGGTGAVFVHGMNKRYYYIERVMGNPSTGFYIAQSPTGHYADAFVAGYIADIDFTNRRCWSENPGDSEFSANCGQNHNGTAY